MHSVSRVALPVAVQRKVGVTRRYLASYECDFVPIESRALGRRGALLLVTRGSNSLLCGTAAGLPGRSCLGG
jgi:hypothetical protein